MTDDYVEASQDSTVSSQVQTITHIVRRGELTIAIHNSSSFELLYNVGHTS